MLFLVARRTGAGGRDGMNCQRGRRDAVSLAGRVGRTWVLVFGLLMVTMPGLYTATIQEENEVGFAFCFFWGLAIFFKVSVVQQYASTFQQGASRFGWIMSTEEALRETSRAHRTEDDTEEV